MAMLTPVTVKQLLNSYTPSYPLSMSLLVCFISFLLVWKLKRRSRLINLPPSPPRLPIIGNLHQLTTLPHRSFAELSQKYGPIMLLHLGEAPTLVVSSADLAREIMKTHDISFADRPQTRAVKILLYGCNDVGFASYGEEWRQKKKICVVELLSMKRVRSFHSIREEEVADMVNNIREAYASNDGCSVNLSDVLIATSNNIVCRCVIGDKYNTKDNSRFGELARKVMIHIASFSVGDLFPSLGWIDVFTGKIREFKATFEALDAFFEQVIAEHKIRKRNSDSNNSDKKDFVDILLQLEEDGILDFELTHQNLKALVMDMFVGGSDTSSSLLEWTFAELLKNPIPMKKAQEEVRRIVGDKSRIDEADVNEMKYLKCVVKETLRLHPPATLVPPRKTRASVQLGGYTIPPGTIVYVNVWAIQRNPQLWERSQEFIPERFENCDIDFKGQHFQYIPFGAGKRGCPGMAFGVTLTEYVLANLLYFFHWNLPPKHDLDMTEVYGLTVSKKLPIHLQPIPYSCLST